MSKEYSKFKLSSGHLTNEIDFRLNLSGSVSRI